MRILQIVHLFPPEQSAGTELYTQALSIALIARGHDCFVLSGSNQTAPLGLLIGEEDSPTVVRLMGLRKRSGLRGDIYDSTVDHLVRRFLDLWRPDVVHLQHWLRLTGNLVAICTELQLPSVVTLHDQWIACSRIHRLQPSGTFCSTFETPCVSCVDRDPWQTDQEVARELGLRSQLLSQELQLADCILVPSLAQQQFLQELTDFPLERLRVLPLGSPADALPKAPADREKPSDAPLIIGYWGHLTPLKGVHVLLEAARLLPEQALARSEWHILGISGDPAYSERLEGLAKGLPVTFHGPYRRPELGTLGLDVAVFPTLGYETYSFVLDEAFRLRIPVIVPDRGAPADRIGQAGITFAAGDAQDLARKIQRLLDEPDILEGLRRGVPKEGEVSMEAHAADMEKIYQETAMSKSKKGKRVQSYRSLLQHREQQLFDREQHISDLERQVGELSHQVTHLTNESQNHQAKLQEQIEESLLLHTKIAERDRLLLALRADLDARTQEATALREQVGERDRQLAVIRGSVLGSVDAALKGFLDRVKARPRHASTVSRRAKEKDI